MSLSQISLSMASLATQTAANLPQIPTQPGTQTNEYETAWGPDKLIPTQAGAQTN